MWATLIGPMEGDEVVVGVVSAPALSRRWWASKNGGRSPDAACCRTPDVGSRECPTSPMPACPTRRWTAGWITGAASSSSTCSVTAGVPGLRRLLELHAGGRGAVDLATEPELALHDMAAVSIVVTEAGGTFTNLNGDPGVAGPGAIATNGLLHDAMVEQLSLN